MLFVLAVAGLAGGGIAYGLGLPELPSWLWGIGTAIVLLATLVDVVASLLRKHVGVDIIAALAMAGSLVLQQFLAGAIIALMLTGGGALERLAVGRARRELSALLKRAPRVAHRKEGDALVDVEIAAVAAGDLLVVKPGEVVPADGVLMQAQAILDEAALTGESRPIQLEAGSPIRSGGTNAGGPLLLQVTASAEGSTYAGIIRLVRSAMESKAPFVRLADRYALGFLLATIILAIVAWVISGSPVRALAVLVVATPCPLILAAPAAIIGGVSQAARRGIIVKGGAPLEALARADSVLLDKTGTVTSGRPKVLEVETTGTWEADEVVRLAASLEQASIHPFAPAIIAEARGRGLELSFPKESREELGKGVAGAVEGRQVKVGQLGFVAPGAEGDPTARAIRLRTAMEGSTGAFVSIDGGFAGAFLVQDPLRPEAPRAVRALRDAGVRRIHMVTGDHPDVAELVGDALGVDRVFAERTPEEKVEVVRRVQGEGVVAMVGDGINDAPALAVADIGIAMGARGATAASEAADIVLMGDRLEGLPLAIRLAQRTRRIASQSVFVGMGLSVVAMLFAAAGRITPVAGALLQEGIDLLVILNALRALGSGGLVRQRSLETAQLASDLASKHASLRPYIGELASLAGGLGSLPQEQIYGELLRMRRALEDEILPHEEEEQERAYPILARLLYPEDPTGPLIQTHQEIRRLVRLYGRLVDRIPPEGPRPEERRDLRRILYGLHAILTLHFAQEDELYSMLEG